ncbi:hypothetical protein BAUCODRAFT_148828 [Baudoinia panamericana UAMH 10762]|uniref:CBF1-interacting co-repressor CIR N-terminal domain-containing protein n=1 Tax=Baudoinia panamericana (strain UAMH 10762) TaxID=717646 RepID=M2LNR9_BAUPA|nr:uncharacterized protein BAUCODRAFT_148828 [Baudoinia panamericana UAMH 10762]EMC95987.1 hypothetical protein BAUCODRAFT_148828 [Baudoinia panamericana UAMH 10762]
MVLHLLGKKSWNVYNTASIERVRRDEAEAAAQNEAEEQRMQEEDAARRIAILRGETPPTVVVHNANVRDAKPSREAARIHDADTGRERKRRRLRGEDDTDRDIRHARENAGAGKTARVALRKQGDDAPLFDDAGHLQLIPEPDQKATSKAEKGKEGNGVARRANHDQNDGEQQGMRFSDAAGFKTSMAKPWYASNKLANAEQNADRSQAGVREKDVWGNEDPRRKDRERNRISSNDPFAAMQHAQQQLKQSEHDRARWQKQRLAELEVSEKTDKRRRRERRHTRRHRDVEDGLEGFSLDASGRPHRGVSS